MTPSELYDRFRSEVVDTAAPYFWSDEDVYSYMDEAQKMFCRLAVGISDSDSDVTVIPFGAGDETVDYDRRILRVRMARLASDYRQVEVVNFEDFIQGSLNSDDYGARRAPVLDDTAGTVRWLVTNYHEGKFRLVYIPQEADTLVLTVYRMPLEDITESSEAFEINEQHHRSLLHYMKALAYQKEDAETFNKQKSMEYEARFRQYCEQVDDEIRRREHKTRTVAYGGL